MAIKIALPKGRLLSETAALLKRADWGLSDYHKEARFYHLQSQKFPNLSVRVFHEKDIPIQVAVGNYDLGICGLDCIEELLAKYPTSALVKVKNLTYGAGGLYVAASKSAGPTVEELQAKQSIIRIATEYPNLAELFALNLRLRRFGIFPLWGAAEVYPPESADLALVLKRTEAELSCYDLIPVSKVTNSNAFLIANRSSWESKDMGELLTSIGDKLLNSEKYPSANTAIPPQIAGQQLYSGAAKDMMWLALPDGHQQSPTLHLLNKAGIQIDDYPSPTGNRRPTTNLPDVFIKVIRPQDMPLQVANGNFDLAITGRDWLTEHLYQFPSSPVAELLDLKFGKVQIVAVVSKDLAEADIHKSMPLRVASEYVNIGDKYARDNHLGPYRVVPTWGASEAFIPKDADLLIENTQTGRTITRHNLRIIDTLFESTACLIGCKRSISNPSKGGKIKSFAETLKTAIEDI